MDNQLGSREDPSAFPLKFDPKLMGQKRTSTDLEGKSEGKRFKMQDRRPNCGTGTETCYSESSAGKEAKKNDLLRKNMEISEIAKEPATKMSDALRARSAGESAMSLSENDASFSLNHADIVTDPKIDLNSPMFDEPSLNVATAHIDESCKRNPVKGHLKVHDLDVRSSKDIQLDLNTVGISNSIDEDPFYPSKSQDHVKSKDTSECGSSTGPIEEKDSLRKWKQMKENGFLSSSHGGIPVPKQRVRKSKIDHKQNELKKRIELAKQEQVNKFAKIAAPSGLLNGLNPGIINHVRNSKQVHSIIENLVRSEKLEKGSQVGSASQSRKGTEEINLTGSDRQNMLDSGAIRFGHPSGAESPNSSLEILGSRKHHMFSNSNSTHSSSDKVVGRGNSNVAQRKTCGETSGASQLNLGCTNETVKQKLTSSVSKGPMSISTLSNEEAANQDSVSSLSVKAANVASQWLDLLSQDIKGRLAALHRSKRRVEAVIQTELPFLLSREFPDNKENHPTPMQSLLPGCLTTSASDMHRARWTTLFEQMDKTLSEEAAQLENWLNQVKEMQLHCEQGLQGVNWFGMQLLGRPDNNSRIKKERELAVRAAAASIYSTCNLVMKTEDSCT